MCFRACLPVSSRSSYEITLVPTSILIPNPICEPKITHFGHQSHHCAKMDFIDWSTEAFFLPKFPLLVFKKFRFSINFCHICIYYQVSIKLPRINDFGHQSHHCAKMDSIDWSTKAVFLPSFTLLVFQNSRSGYEITLGNIHVLCKQVLGFFWPLTPLVIKSKHL